MDGRANSMGVEKTEMILTAEGKEYRDGKTAPFASLREGSLIGTGCYFKGLPVPGLHLTANLRGLFQLEITPTVG